MGYKQDLARFFKGRWLNSDFIATDADIAGTQLADKTVTYDKIADATITTDQISASAGITGSQLASKTVTYGKIADATITTSQISATAAIAGTQLASNAAIAGSQLAANAAIAGTQLASNAAIAGSQLSATAAIAGTQLASKTVTYDRIADATITPSQLGAGCVKTLSGTVAHGDTSKTVLTIPAYSLVTDVFSVCTVTWNGSPTVKLGVSGTGEGFIAAAKMATGLTQGNVIGTTNSDRGTLLWQPLVLTYSEGNADTITTQASPLQYYVGAASVDLLGTVGGTPGANGSCTVYCVYVALA